MTDLRPLGSVVGADPHSPRLSGPSDLAPDARPVGVPPSEAGARPAPAVPRKEAAGTHGRWIVACTEDKQRARAKPRSALGSSWYMKFDLQGDGTKAVYRGATVPARGSTEDWPPASEQIAEVVGQLAENVKAQVAEALQAAADSADA